MVRPIVAMALLLPMLATAQVREPEELRRGVVYSYVSEGKRHYASRPPPEGIVFRRIGYSYRVSTGERFFGRYRCTDLCEGHQAGYEWAGKRRVQTFDQCAGRSQSFIEGCYVYLQERL